MSEKIKEVNISDAVGVSVEAATILGLDIASEPDLLTDVLKNDYAQLVNSQPRPGEPFIHLPPENDYQLRKILDTMDGHLYKNNQKYPSFSVWHRTHWTHGASDISHLLVGRRQKQDTDISYLSGQSRLALSDGENPMFPFVHFANMPFDKINVKQNDDERDDETQIDAYRVSRDQFETENPDFDMFTMDVSSFAMLTLHQRIRGDRNSEPLGVMIIPELGRKRIVGGLAVAIVHASAGGQIGMGWSRGNRSPGTGIGVSIGCNK